MRRPTSLRNRRPGAFLVFTAVILIMLIGMVALAVDLAVMQVARNQCQNAADMAALAGARQLNGEVTGDPVTEFNRDEAIPHATSAAKDQAVFGRLVQDSQLVHPVGHAQAGQVSITVGSYGYDEVNRKFIINESTKGPNDGWSLVTATVYHTQPSFFSRVFGTNSLDVGAKAVASHRPRDIALVVDFSGSMRYDTTLGGPFLGVSGSSYVTVDRDRSLNADPAYPGFGHYSSFASKLAPGSNIQVPTGELQGRGNVAIPLTGDDPNWVMANSFWGDATAGSYTVPAFTKQPASYATTPGGDQFPKTSGGAWAYTAAHQMGLSNVGPTPRVQPPPFTPTSLSGWQQRPSDPPSYWPPTGLTYVWPHNPPANAMNRNSWENTGHANFQGYTMGPSYWGKTFWIWPPDPRGPANPVDISNNNGAKDWRKRLFIQVYLGRTNSSTTPGNPPSGGGGGGGGGSPPPPPPPGLALHFLQNSTTLSLGTPLGNPLRPINFREPLDDNNLMFDTNGAVKNPGVLTTLEIYSLRTPYTLPSPATASNKPTFQRTFENYTYLINYDAFLYWIKNVGPNPFPSQLRSGGVVYYTAIPDSISPSNLTVHPIPTTTQDNRNQRFWKEYIDECLGLQQTGFTTRTVNNALDPTTGTRRNVSITVPTYNWIERRTGYGGQVQWRVSNTWENYIHMRPDYVANPPSLGNIAYMDYRDNPDRPLVRTWFGPMSLIDFMGNLNMSRAWFPGTSYESPMWQCKVGVQTAIQDIQNNHPNDQIALVSFSRPSGYGPHASDPNATGPFSSGYYNLPRSAMGRNYNGTIDSIWFPQQFISNRTEISNIWSTQFDQQVPRAVGGTCYSMGLMLAYNQFAVGATTADLQTYTTNPATPGISGGKGRKGAQKVVVFESDGAVSAAAYRNLSDVFNNAGAYDSYFRVRLRDSTVGVATGNEFPDYVVGAAVGSLGGGFPNDQAREVAQVICNSDQHTSYPGFSIPRKPAKIHCLAFGPLFDPANTGASTVTARTNALNLMQFMQYVGGVQSSPTIPLESYKRIYGTGPTRIANMKTAYSRIMQDGYSVSLIR